MIRRLALLALLGACTPPPQAREARPVTELDDVISEWLPASSPSAPRRELAGPPREPRELARASRATRPRSSGRRIDVTLQHASLDAALQLLASEAGVGLVLPDPLAATVSVSLRRVDPLDALITLAEAQGLSVERQERLLVVRRR
jgi:hypothetical protein